ncbi:MAG: hypothetical protein U9R52_01440 [Candidatus Omnitrophota bacterium]|nr:hypothetical protein [Candidatus Omnitrophota bacterium]
MGMKIKFLLWLSLSMMLGLSFLSTPAFAKNELLNVGFEDEAQDPWYWWGGAGTGTYGVKNYVHTGEKSAKIAADGGDYIVLGFLQDLGCMGREKIKISAWAMSPANTPLTNSNAFIKLEFWEGEEIVEVFESEHQTDAFDWTKLEVSGTAPEGTTKVKIGLFIWNPGSGHSGEVYFDDTSLIRKKSLRY